MKAYVTSIGEPTTDLCIWSLERQGFEVELIKGDDSLAHKLEYIYSNTDDDFLRVDADVIVNKNIKLLEFPTKSWWVQPLTFDWWKQDVTYGGVQLISNKALPALRRNITAHLDAERPETDMSRLPELFNPRRFSSVDILVGLHGYKQSDVNRVIDTKERRGQLGLYDFELAERLNNV